MECLLRNPGTGYMAAHLSVCLKYFSKKTECSFLGLFENVRLVLMKRYFNALVCTIHLTSVLALLNPHLSMTPLNLLNPSLRPASCMHFSG